MKQVDVERFVSSLTDVQRTDSFGYTFFFVGGDHRIPFVTIAGSDNEYDNVSNLNRAGIFRVNVGIKKETFEALVGQLELETIDYSELNLFMPHPHYSRQCFICILNPADDNIERLKEIVVEAHSIAKARSSRNSGASATEAIDEEHQ